jgi:hypothetical protein
MVAVINFNMYETFVAISALGEGIYENHISPCWLIETRSREQGLG